MDFGEVLSKAWRIIWKHKILWIFGIFAGCSSGGRGGGSSSWQQDWDPGSSSGPGMQGQAQHMLQQAGQWLSDNLWIAILVGLAVLILAVLSLFLGTIGKIGLIRGTFQADQGTEHLSFSDLFKGSLPFFWRVFLLSFLVGLVFLVIFVPLILFGVVTAGIGFLCILPLLCLMIPLGLVVTTVLQMANAAMVIENLSMANGIRRGWELVKQKLGPVLVILLITAVVGLVIGFVLAIPLLIVAIPLILGFATGDGGFPTAAAIVSGLCLVIYLPVLLVLQGILTAYVESVWALTFLRLTRPAESKGAPEALPTNA